MGQTVPKQHPAVVLRTHYVHLRALLVAALVALVALTIAVVVLATSETNTAGAPSSATSISAPGPTGTTRYDGGPEEGTRGTGPAPGVYNGPALTYNGPH
jgi:hypothetical protein